METLGIFPAALGKNHPMETLGVIDAASTDVVNA